MNRTSVDPIGRSITSPTNLLRDLHALPSALLLRRIEVERSVSAFVQGIRRVGPPPALRELVLGPFSDDRDEGEPIYDIHPIYPAVPQLELLQIKGRWLDLNRPKLPELRSFGCKANPTTRGLMRQIRRARWPKLERLELWFTSLVIAEYDDGAEENRAVEVDDLRPLMSGQVEWPALRHLRLSDTAFTDQLARELVRSKLARQLVTLDLSGGRMTAVGARTLCEAADRLATLKRLDLSGNPVGAAKGELRAAFGDVVVM